MEAKAIETVFGKGRRPAVTAIKSMLGESYSAAGALQAAAATLAIESRTIPPTIGYSEPDPECCPSTIVIVTEREQRELSAVLINSFGCNGGNASLVLTGLTNSRR